MPTFANQFPWTRYIRPTFANQFPRTRYIRPTFANQFPRTRYIRSRSTFATFEKNVTRLDTFAQVICQFGEFGASGHCLEKLQKKKMRVLQHSAAFSIKLRAFQFR